jgi:UDP-N-acetylglucosamine 4-epimerase
LLRVTRGSGGSYSHPPPRSTAPIPSFPSRRRWPVPIAPYAVSKLAAEGYCRAFFHVYGLETVSLRYFIVFGPRQDPRSQYAAVIPRFITAVLDGERPVIYGDGEQSRDFTFIENAVEANMLAAQAEAVGGQTFNIACGTRITLNRVIDELRVDAGDELEPLYEENRPGDVRHSLADISRAREKLGYAPVVDFPTGLRRTYSYYRELRASGGTLAGVP